LEPGGLNVERIRTLLRGDKCPYPPPEPAGDPFTTANTREWCLRGFRSQRLVIVDGLHEELLSFLNRRIDESIQCAGANKEVWHGSLEIVPRVCHLLEVIRTISVVVGVLPERPCRRFSTCSFGEAAARSRASPQCSCGTSSTHKGGVMLAYLQAIGGLIEDID